MCDNWQKNSRLDFIAEELLCPLFAEPAPPTSGAVLMELRVFLPVFRLRPMQHLVLLLLESLALSRSAVADFDLAGRADDLAGRAAFFGAADLFWADFAGRAAFFGTDFAGRLLFSGTLLLERGCLDPGPTADVSDKSSSSERLPMAQTRLQ